MGSPRVPDACPARSRRSPRPAGSLSEKPQVTDVMASRPQPSYGRHGLRSPLPTTTPGGQQVPAGTPGTQVPRPPRAPAAPQTPHCKQANGAPGAITPRGLCSPRPHPENRRPSQMTWTGAGVRRTVSGGTSLPLPSAGPWLWALTVHAGGPGSRGARDLPLSAGTASRLPGDRPPRLAAVPVQGHDLTGAGGQLTCKRGTDTG